MAEEQKTRITTIFQWCVAHESLGDPEHGQFSFRDRTSSEFHRECQERVLKMLYSRYLRTTAKPVSEVEFGFSDWFGFLWETGTIVTPAEWYRKQYPDRADWSYGVIVELEPLHLQIDTDKGRRCMWSGEVAKANMPPALLELAKKQMQAKCPLKEVGCV